MANTNEKDVRKDEEKFEQAVVVITDDEGNETYYTEELILKVNEDRFALLAPTVADEEVATQEDVDDDADAAFFAKIVQGEDGEDTYIEPSDEEFKIVCKMYEDLLEKEEQSK